MTAQICVQVSVVSGGVYPWESSPVLASEMLRKLVKMTVEHC